MEPHLRSPGRSPPRRERSLPPPDLELIAGHRRLSTGHYLGRNRFAAAPAAHCGHEPSHLPHHRFRPARHRRRGRRAGRGDRARPGPVHGRRPGLHRRTGAEAPAPGVGMTLVEAMPFSVACGVEVDAAGPEEVKARMEWSAERCTAGGVLHGGALMTLADSVGGICAFLNLPEGAVTSTVESKTNFLRP